MSSVSPNTDKGLTEYYRKALKDVSREAKDEARRNEELRNRELDRVEKDYQADLKHQDREADQVLRRVRERSAEALAKEKETHTAEIDDLHNSQRYNKYGFDHSTEIKEREKREIDDLTKELKAEEKRHRDVETSRENEWNEHTNKELLKRDIDADNTVRKMKDESIETLNRNKAENRAEIEAIKHKLYNSRGQVPGAVPPEQMRYQIDGMNAAMEKQREADRKAFQAREDDNSQLLRDVERQNQAKLGHLTRQNAEDNRRLVAQMKEMSDSGTGAEKSRADVNEKLSKNFRENEKLKIRQLENDYNEELAKFKRGSDNREDYLLDHTEKTMKEKENYFADRIREQNNLNNANLSRLQNTMGTQIGDLEKQGRESRDRADNTHSETLKQAGQDKKNALDKQANAFRETLNRQRANDEAEMSIMNKELKERRNPNDMNQISPAAENKVRQSVIREYEKTLGTELDHHKERLGEAQRKYTESITETTNDYREKEADRARQEALTSQADKNNFLNSNLEIDFNAKNTVRTERLMNDRERETMRRNQEIFTERQRKQFEFVIQNDRAEAASRLNAVRQANSQELQNQHRLFAQATNDLVRDYDLKMEDMKTGYENQIENLKLEMTMVKHDLERQLKENSALQTKDFESRFAKQDVQNKERERYISQNYEDKIDKLKRGYELSKKKS